MKNYMGWILDTLKLLCGVRLVFCLAVGLFILLLFYLQGSYFHVFTIFRKFISALCKPSKYKVQRTPETI